jgi:hypothetical protein
MIVRLKCCGGLSPTEAGEVVSDATEVKTVQKSGIIGLYKYVSAS